MDFSPQGYHSPSNQCSGTDMVFQIYVYMHSQFLSHVIIIEGKVLLPQAHVTLADFGYPV